MPCASFLEEFEGIESHLLSETAVLQRVFLYELTLRQGEDIEEHDDAQQSRDEELIVCVLKLMSVLRQSEREGAIVPHRAVDKEHSNDESYGTAGADGRKVGDGVAAVVLQDGESGSVRQC